MPSPSDVADASSASASLRDRWLLWRDQTLASPVFQRWASGVPGLRWIARRRARAVFDLVAGFVYSQVLEACIRLRLFQLLADGPLSLTELAHRMSLAPPQTERLLLAAVSLRLVERRRCDRFGLGVLGAPLVGNAAVEAMVLHHGALYADLRDPVALLRGQSTQTALAAYWPYAGDLGPSDPSSAQTRQAAATYTSLMAASQPLVAHDVLDAYPMHQHRHLLDLGGGDGSFIALVAERHHHLNFTLLDLPDVAARARMNLAERGLQHRVQVVDGSFFTPPQLQGADLVTLVRVVHDHDDDAALAILRTARTALPVGGVLLLAEPMSETPGAEPMGDAYFGFYLLAMGQGRPRTVDTLKGMLCASGFAHVRLLPTRLRLQTQVLLATASPIPDSWE